MTTHVHTQHTQDELRGSWLTRSNFLGSNIADNVSRSRVCIRPKMAIPCHNIGTQWQRLAGRGGWDWICHALWQKILGAVTNGRYVRSYVAITCSLLALKLNQPWSRHGHYLLTTLTTNIVISPFLEMLLSSFSSSLDTIGAKILSARL